MDDAALDEVIPLLAGAIEAAYGERYPEPALRDAFAQATFIRSLFVCRGPVKRGLLRLAEPLFGKPGTVMGHVTPARLRPGLPETWKHPFTGEEFTGGIPTLLERAEQRCGLYLAAGRAYWAGSMTMQELSALLGSRSYLSGTEDAPKSFGEKLSNAFTDGLAAVAEGLENFAIWLAYSWLGILIFAAVVFAAVKLIGRLRRGQKLPKIGRKKNKNTANETKVEE